MSVMTAFSEGRTRLRKKQREGGRERRKKRWEKGRKLGEEAPVTDLRQ